MDRAGPPWTNPPSTPTLDWALPPWSNPPSTPTLDFANGGPDYPPEVSAAIGRFRMQAWSDADRQTLIGFLVAHSDQLDAEEANALGDIIGAMGGGGVAPDSATSGMTIADRMAQNQAVNGAQASPTPTAPANPLMAQASPTPLPTAPPITGSTQTIPSAPMDPMLTGQQGVRPALAQQGAASISSGLGGADMARGGIPNAVALSQRMPRDLRAEDPARRAGREGTNWKTVAAMGDQSAFADIPPQYLEAFASNPAMASREMYGKGMMAQGMTPQVQGALELSALGLLGGGGHTRGIGGPKGDIARLGQAESFLQGLGPGEYVDPTSVYRQTFRKLRKTPTEQLFTGQGEPGDISNQIEATNNALLEPLKVYGSQEDLNGLAAMLDAASQDYVDGIVHGSIDVTMSYPEWLRQQRKAQRFMG